MMEVSLQFVVLYISILLVYVHGWKDVCELNKDKVYGGIYFSCSHHSLKQIPSQFPNNTTTIDLSNNLISIVKDYSFQHAKRLKVLSLSLNKITHFDAYAFDGCDGLEYLDISFNSLELTPSSYPNGVFSSLGNLITLYMQNNLLGDVGSYPDIFRNLTKLETLRIDSFTTPKFSEGMKKLVGLRNLVFANELCTMDTLRNDTFLMFQNLSIEALDFHHCHLVSVESGAFEPLLKLKKLSLADSVCGIKNALRNLAPFHGRDMKTLDLSIVRFAGPVTTIGIIQDQILNAADVKHLGDICTQRVNLRYNNIIYLNPISLINTRFSKCVTHLNLSKNNLRFGYDFVLVIEQMPNLIHLDISNQKGAVRPDKKYTTKVSYLPFNYTSMKTGLIVPFPKSLQHLNMSSVGGNFGRVEGNVTFLNGQSLRVFDGSYLGVSDITGHIFGFDNLLVFKASGNPNLKILDTFFETAPSLEILDLSDYSMKQATLLRQGKRLLQPLKKLKTLNLKNNHLVQLPSDLLEANTQLTHLDLSNNAFTSIPYDVRKLLHLEVFDLSSNTIRNLVKSTRVEIEEQVAEAGGFNLLLDGNIFSCSCANFEFFRWIKEKDPRVHLDKNGNYSCLLEQGLESNTGYQVEQLTHMWRKCIGVKLFYISSSSLVILVAMLLSLLLVNTNKTILFQIMMNIFRQEIAKPRRAHFRRDLYISYAEDDYQWVCHHLCPALEERHLSLFIWDRDSVPGDSIPDQIVENVQSCWKILLYYTDNFQEDPWTYMSVMAAINLVDDNSPEKVLLLMPEDENPRVPYCLLEVIPESCIIRIPGGSCNHGNEELWETIARKVKEE